MSLFRSLLAVAALLVTVPAAAQTVTVTTPNTVNPSGSPTPVGKTFIINPDGTVATISGGGGGTTQVEGTATTGGTVPTKPVLVGGSNGTLIYPIGVDSTSNQFVTIRSGSTAITAGNDSADGVTVNSSATNLRMLGRNTYFNGTQWDRQRGDVNGAWVQGNLANGAVDAGNPVKIAGSDGTNVRTLMTASNGALILGSASGTTTVAVSNMGSTTDGVANSGGVLNTLDRGYLFNGTTWDRQRGDLNGVWTQGNVASGATDVGNPAKVGGVYRATLPTLSDGQRGDLQLASNGMLLTSIGSSVGITATVASPGEGASNASALTTRGFNMLFNGSTWDRARSIAGSTNSGNGVAAVAIQPCAVAGCGITPTSTTSASSGVVAKASGGNVYRVAVTSGASAGYIIGLNQTTIPADGATPNTVILCRPIAATSALSIGYSDMPSFWPTGIVFVFSTTGCFTITKSATAFIEYHVQ